MVDFKKLRESKKKQIVTDPIEIFRRLPKPPEITDLYTSQAQVLGEWYQRRNERDIVIKLHTGGGKTLVGLLIAQSIINEIHEPVIYLSPTVQLVEQTLKKANEYGISCVIYEKGKNFHDDFLTGKSVLICTYQALFNGMSKFGAPGSKRDVLKAGAIILDDAHVSFNSIRESYSLRIQRNSENDRYETLTNIFRNDFKKLGKLGTFDDVVSGSDYNTLEIPYWSWKSKSAQVSAIIREISEEYPFVWPLIRDSFDYCHALISKSSFVVTPIFPLVDIIPTFSKCKKRIYMSATIGDDSSIIRTFNADYSSISKPIYSRSLAGVSERMILAPELMNFKNTNIPEMLKKVAEWATESLKVATVILVPSNQASLLWNDVAECAENPDAVAVCVDSLQNESSLGPFVFSNRYDGIDLPDNSCRLLIISGLPRGTSEYDLFRSNVFLDGEAINSSLSQRIEQGMGRAARGPGDYCVVIITGKDLISWIGRSSNLKFLTSSTKAQLQIGLDVSKDVKTPKEFARTLQSCLNRDKDWIKYHAETLAESIRPEKIDLNALKLAQIEQKAFQLWRDGYYEKAIAEIDKFCNADRIDKESKGWLFQQAARIAYYWDQKDKAQEFQEYAFSENRYLFRPQIIPPYNPISNPSKQAESIVKTIDSFNPRIGFMSYFEETIVHLVPEASANQFEQSLEIFGKLLGFSTDRPEKSFGIGPDVIWLLNDKLGLVIEAKSRKEKENALTKKQHGQILVSTKWFQKEYPDHKYIAVSIHPNISATKNAVADETKALTIENLNKLISDSRELFEALCHSYVQTEALVERCNKMLIRYNLKAESIPENFLLPFELEK